MDQESFKFIYPQNGFLFEHIPGFPGQSDHLVRAFNNSGINAVMTFPADFLTEGVPVIRFPRLLLK